MSNVDITSLDPFEKTTIDTEAEKHTMKTAEEIKEEMLALQVAFEVHRQAAIVQCKELIEIHKISRKELQE